MVANGLSGGRALAQASNLHLRHVGAVEILGLVLVVVVLAPITEELMFRGLLLRSFMRRLSFWPAALISTALFAVFHVYEVHTVLGAVTLAASVGVLGLGNCWLVRITGRLTPGIMVHASLQRSRSRRRRPARQPLTGFSRPARLRYRAARLSAAARLRRVSSCWRTSPARSRAACAVPAGYPALTTRFSVVSAM